MNAKTSICYVFLIFLLYPNNTLGQEFVPVTISSYRTSYGDYGKLQNRAHNIRRASNLVSSMVIQPGEQFSFNNTVGVRTKANGFRKAPVILMGRMAKGFGGGICQVASTIYAAAVYAGLQIVEHHPHTRVSPYISPGLDAAVDWGTKDLIFTNSLNFPITLIINNYSGRFPAEKIIDVKFLSRNQTHDVDVGIVVRKISDFIIVEESVNFLLPHERKVVEQGTPSLYVRLNQTVRSFLDPEYFSFFQREFVYPSSPRVIQVGKH